MTKTQTFLLSGGFVLLLFAGTLLFWFLPDKSFSAEENRSLRTFPHFTVERLLTGAFASDMNEYFADQFPARDCLVGIKGACEIFLGKGENNGILQGKDGQLAKRLFDVRRTDGSLLSDTDLFDAEHIRTAAQNLVQVARESQYPIKIMLPPRTLDVTASAFSYPNVYGESLHETLQRELSSCGAYMDLLPLLQKQYENGEEVYFKTDHHWTARGAYSAYVAFMTSMGMEEEIIPINTFEKRTVSNSFRGTLWSAGGMKFVSPDSLEVWYLGNEDDFCVNADGKIFDGFYNLAYLDGKDHYSLFLDGTHEVVTVTKKQETRRPHLLILKDSFANSMAPFLAQHFDLTLLNLSSARMQYTDVNALAEQYGADAVLIVYTLGNLINTDRIQRLKSGSEAPVTSRRLL